LAVATPSTRSFVPTGAPALCDHAQRAPVLAFPDRQI
jgi:hypothetical protein